MHQGGLNKKQAYDTARREFYALRQEEAIEARVAKEEARYVGAYFGKSRLDISMDIEDQQFEAWKVWAGHENLKIQASRASAYQTFGNDSEEAPLEDEQATETAAAA
jgi:small subunit ribosomal protein S23